MLLLKFKLKIVLAKKVSCIHTKYVRDVEKSLCRVQD